MPGVTKPQAMERTISASLNGKNFIFEESAYTMMNTYLYQYRLLIRDGNKDDIMKAVEVTMAQLLTAKLGNESIVEVQMVRESIERIGMPDGSRFEYSGNNNSKHGPFSGRRFFRSEKNAMIGGVCQGLANFLGIDVSIMRLIFLLAMFFGLSGFWIYIVLWIAIPSESSEIARRERATKEKSSGYDQVRY